MTTTTQQGVWTSTELLSRRVRVGNFCLHQKRLKGTWYVDTLISKVKSIIVNTAANVYTHGNFAKVYPIMALREAGQSIIDFNDNVGVPEMLLTEGAGAFTGRITDFLKHAGLMGMQLHNSKKGKHNQKKFHRA